MILNCDHMISAVMQRRTPRDLELLLKSSARSFCDMLTSQQPYTSTASNQNFNNTPFHIIHPFHPYRNIEFQVDSVRRLAYEYRVFFTNTKGRKSSVPLHWTNIGPEDLFVAVSAGCSLFRVEDLLSLVRLIGEINSANSK